MVQNQVSEKNADFWNELCGSPQAKKLGIKDYTIESLKRYDDWYFDFYPYLFDHIPFDKVQNKDVLEIGLGYGTVSQRLAESGAQYTGLDIAQGPVEMVNQRLKQCELNGKAIQGSILEPDFAPESFDTIIAIGCLHHSGDLKLAIDNCWKLLRPGGSLIFMVYYAYSYRRYRIATKTTLQHLLRELLGYRGVVGKSTEAERAAHDVNVNGTAAPHTDWISVRSLKSLCQRFSSFSSTVENIGQDRPFTRIPREKIINTLWPRLIGLNLYASAVK